MDNIFPRGVAIGHAFYDRKKERKKLGENIFNTVHTVLLAPRRYGKTSLISQVIYEKKINHIWFDFMMITSKEDMQLKFLQKISSLIVQLSPTQEKLKQIVIRYFNKLKPEIIFSVPGISLKLTPTSQQEDITSALIGLDKLAGELKERLAIVCDEFQEILRIDKDLTLQGAIRHAAERAKNISYIFSGSKHRALRRIFNGKEHPLYSLCENMELNKIPENEYIEFINNAAIKKWGKSLSPEVMSKILLYSDRYPKYVNILCGAAWIMNTIPTCKIIDELWQEYILSKKTDITEDLSGLTLNQLRLLQFLVKNPTTELYSKNTLFFLKMSQASIQKSIEALLENGFVICEEKTYKVSDPIVISYFNLF